MAGSMLARAVLALVLSGAVATGSLEMYPAALGVLVASKAYGVVRSAVVPRLLPQGFSLVKANSRVTLGGLLATGVAAPVGAGLQMIGPGWPLYGACLLFLGGAFLSFRLPPKVDSARGERRALLAADEQHLAAAVDARWDPVTTDDKTDDKTDSTDNKEEEKDRDGERGRGRGRSGGGRGRGSGRSGLR